MPKTDQKANFEKWEDYPSNGNFSPWVYIQNGDTSPLSPIMWMPKMRLSRRYTGITANIKYLMSKIFFIFSYSQLLIPSEKSLQCFFWFCSVTVTVVFPFFFKPALLTVSQRHPNVFLCLRPSMILYARFNRSLPLFSFSSVLIDLRT